MLINIYKINLYNDYYLLTCTNIYTACIHAGAPWDLVQLDNSATTEKLGWPEIIWNVMTLKYYITRQVNLNIVSDLLAGWLEYFSKALELFLQKISLFIYGSTRSMVFSLLEPQSTRHWGTSLRYTEAIRYTEARLFRALCNVIQCQIYIVPFV